VPLPACLAAYVCVCVRARDCVCVNTHNTHTHTHTHTHQSTKAPGRISQAERAARSLERTCRLFLTDLLAVTVPREEEEEREEEKEEEKRDYRSHVDAGALLGEEHVSQSDAILREKKMSTGRYGRKTQGRFLFVCIYSIKNAAA
jgi:hypothetical protein